MSASLISVLNPKRLKRVKFLGELFKEGGHELRIAGGAVRDILSGKEPHDIDFASTATPDEALKLLKPHEDIVRIIVTVAGQQHGTVAVKFKEVEFDFKRIKLATTNSTKKIGSDLKHDRPEYDDESPFEITTLRIDKVADGRHAEVVFVNDWKLDAERRDLTINAMFLTLDEGKLIDFYNGEEDLKNGVVRFVGDADRRIKEDYLRILRYFRFWSRYGRNRRPDSYTLETIRQNLSGLEVISKERIWIEIKKIFSHLPCVEVVDLMLELRVLNAISFCDKSGEEYETFGKSVIEELRVVEKNVLRYRDEFLDPKDERLKDLLPVILFSTTIDTVEWTNKDQRKLKLSNLERETISFIVKHRTDGITYEKLKEELALAKQQDRSLVKNMIQGYMIYANMLDHMAEFLSWNCPAFPQIGHIIAREVKKYHLHPSKITEINNQLKKDWITSDCKMEIEDIQKRAVDIVAQMNEAKESKQSKTE